ncbi:MAG: glycosyltransferase family 4 protein [Chromatiales bacterium]|nr:glycosyltransferase family 4 protein [Chromatiales bacterium]
MATSGREPVDVALIYRRPAPVGGTSIPTAFDRVLTCFSDDPGFRLRKVELRHPSQGVLPRLLAARQARNEAGAINHITGDVHFLALALPAKNTILTIHDLDFLHRSRGLRRWLLKKLWLDLPVSRCRLITTVSQATRDDLLGTIPAAGGKTRVVHGLISAGFHRGPARLPCDPPVILHIGTKPNKNLRRHIEALKGIRCRLRIIGRPNATDIRLLSQYAIDHDVQFGLPETAMQQVYEQADLLLFASTREGFGMPIVEAQTVGRPVVTSDLSSMPEIAGTGAHLVDPFDVESIRNGVLKVLNDGQYRRQLVEKGFRNIMRFDPINIAEQWRTLYSQIR